MAAGPVQSETARRGLHGAGGMPAGYRSASDLEGWHDVPMTATARPHGLLTGRIRLEDRADPCAGPRHRFVPMAG